MISTSHWSIKILIRLGINALTLLFIISLSFWIMKNAPGKPFETEKAASPAVMAELKQKYDFTYAQYLSGIFFHGDFRFSYSHRDSKVIEILSEGLPISMELGFYALSLAAILGLISGLMSALLRGQWVASLIMGVAVLGIALPNFVLGSLLQLVFATRLRWVDVAGWSSFSNKLLPVFTLSLAYLAYITRIARGSFLDNLQKDYVRTAHAKGLSDFTIFWKHLLRNSVLPVINYLGPAAAYILTGTLVVEKIFNIPGMGRYFIESVFQRDYPLALGVIIVYSCFLLLFNLITDIVQTFIDPRIQLQ